MTYPETPHHIRLSAVAVPKAANLRSIPLSWGKEAIDAVKQMEAQGIWEPITTPRWVHLW